jgi:hypothetical protein
MNICTKLFNAFEILKSGDNKTFYPFKSLEFSHLVIPVEYVSTRFTWRQKQVQLPKRFMFHVFLERLFIEKSHNWSGPKCVYL